MLGVLLLAFDLIALGWYVELDPNNPQRGFASGSPALAYLQENAGMQRVEISTSAWQPNLPQLEGLYSIDGVYNPLELSNYAVYIGSVGYRGSVEPDYVSHTVRAGYSVALDENEATTLSTGYALTLDAGALIWIDGVIVESGRAPDFAAARPVLKPMEAVALMSFASRR